MKARFFAIAALVLGLASCQKDFNAEVNSASEVDFKFSVAAPELAMTRAGDTAEKPQNALDSAFGAIDYFQGTDWKQVDLRYTLEVYDYRADGNYAGQEPVKDRMAIVLDSYQATTFELRLAPKRDYHFVVFADFVEDGATAWSELDKLTKDGLRHRIGDTLASIELIDVDGEELNDEKSDAYFATAKINPSNNTNNMEAIELTRPYAKVRVVATDLHELNLNVKPASVMVAYNELNANTFNAVEGTISGTHAKKEFNYTYTDPHVYTAGKDAETTTTVNGDVRNTHMTLFTDYILAKDEQEAIQFVMTVFDEKNEIIKETNFYTEIPVQRNYLTTIIGNVLTTATEIEVTINDNFAGNHFVGLWDGKSTTMPKYDDATKTYIISEASELAWVAAQVNGTTRATAHTFEGYTIKLAKDIHLNGERWDPIGSNGLFKGTFDGDGHMIEDLYVSVDGNESAGLFANCQGTIKNLTVVDAEVYGRYKAGVIVGDGLCSRIENCHVDGAVVLSTPYLKDNGNNAGGIVGYLSAEPTAYVKGCSVKNSKITAYRKVGGIVGAANGKAEVTGNTIKACYITADMTAEYKEVKPADAGQVVGWMHADAVVENNTVGSTAVVDNVNVAVRINKAEDINPNLGKTLILESGVYEFTEDLNGKGTTFQAAAGAKVTFNGNGHKFNLGTDMNYGLIIKSSNEEETEFVINDVEVVSGGGGLAANGGAKLIFNGSSVYVDSNSTSARYVVYAEGDGTEIIINGGTFGWDPADNTRRAYVYTGVGAKVVINGGTFGKASSRADYKAGIRGDGETIINAGTFGFDPTKWVAADSSVKKDGTNWVVTPPVVVENATGLADAIANAAEGSTIVLKDNINYGAITAGKLKNVTINGAENSVVNFITDANTEIENVTLNGVDFVYDGTNLNSGVVINAEAKIENLVLDGCSFVGTGEKKGRGIYGTNPNATIVIKNTTFKDLGYPIYTMANNGGYKSLIVEECTFDNIKSWAIMPQYNPYTGDLTVNKCNFVNCIGGLVRAGSFTAGHAFTFTNNTITNSAEHPAKNWFQITVGEGTAVVDNNTKDGAAWTPGAAEGIN